MGDLLFASDRVDDQVGLVRGLEAAGHHVRVRSLADVARERDFGGAAIVDAVKDFFAGRDAIRSMRAVDDRLPIIAIVAADHLDGVGPDWGLTSFVLEPSSPQELAARLRLVVAPASAEEEPVQLRVGDLVIDPESYQVRLKGQPVDLTYKEFQLLAFLAQRPGRVWTRQQLLQEVWGYDFFGGTRTVDVHVRRLRAKLGPEHEAMIGTIRNVGYKLEARTR